MLGFFMPNPVFSDDINSLVADLRAVGSEYIDRPGISEKDAGIAQELLNFKLENTKSPKQEFEILKKLNDIFISGTFFDEPESPADDLTSQVRKIISRHPPFVKLNLHLEDYENLGHVIHALYEKMRPYNYVSLANHDEAVEQVVAQEFLRLIIPEQPYTKFFLDSDTSHVTMTDVGSDFGLITVDTPGVAENIDNGNLRNYFRIDTINICIFDQTESIGELQANAKGTIIKTDTAPCFSTSTKFLRAATADLEELYKPYLDVLAITKHMHKEINETLLRLLILPKEMITSFIHKYSKDKELVHRIQESINWRLSNLYEAAVICPEFQTYLKTEEANKEINEAIKIFKKFKTSEGNKGILVPAFITQINDNFNMLKEHANDKSFKQDDFPDTPRSYFESISLPIINSRASTTSVPKMSSPAANTRSVKLPSLNFHRFLTPKNLKEKLVDVPDSKGSNKLKK
jgi:hypothetical protein